MKIKFIAVLLIALILLFAFASCNIDSDDNDYSTTNESKNDTETDQKFENDESESNKEQQVLGEVDFSKIIFITYDERFVEKYGSSQITVETDEKFDDVFRFTMNLFVFMDYEIITNSGNASEKVIGLDNIKKFYQNDENKVSFSIGFINNDPTVIKELTRDPEIVQIIISVPQISDE